MRPQPPVAPPAVMSGVVMVSTKAGADPYDAIQGASQGVIQGVAEAHGDLMAAAAGAIESAVKMAGRSGISEKQAAAEVTEGVLQAAEAIGDEAVAQVMEALVKE